MLPILGQGYNASARFEEPVNLQYISAPSVYAEQREQDRDFARYGYLCDIAGSRLELRFVGVAPLRTTLADSTIAPTFPAIRLLPDGHRPQTDRYIRMKVNEDDRVLSLHNYVPAAISRYS